MHYISHSLVEQFIRRLFGVLFRRGGLMLYQGKCGMDVAWRMNGSCSASWCWARSRCASHCARVVHKVNIYKKSEEKIEGWCWPARENFLLQFVAGEVTTVGELTSNFSKIKRCLRRTLRYPRFFHPSKEKIRRNKGTVF